MLRRQNQRPPIVDVDHAGITGGGDDDHPVPIVRFKPGPHLSQCSTEHRALIFEPDGNKAGVLLMDLRQPGEFTDDLFVTSQPIEAYKVMGVG